MFTGIVQAVGKVTGVRPGEAATGLEVDLGAWGFRPSPGDSLSVSGCCLTVVGGESGVVQFDVVPETLVRTTLGSWRPGRSVNLEPPATPATLLGGHVVQGHVDGVGVVEAVDRGEGFRVRIRAPAGFGKWLVPKGSVAVDGVSLTLASVEPSRDRFEVALIPATLAATTLGALTPGDRCNLEADVIAKTVVNFLEHFGKGVGDRG